LLAISYLVLYSKDSSNAFRRLRRRGKPPAKFRKHGGAAPIKTVKEPVKNIGSDHILNFGGKKIFNHFVNYYNFDTINTCSKI
jgi:hypothetical protein